VEWLVRPKVIIEGLESSEEAGFLLGPREWRRVVPTLSPLHRAERPVEQIAHVGENLDGLTATTIEGREAIRCAVKGASGSVGEAGYGMTKEFACVGHTGKLYRMGRSAG